MNVPHFNDQLIFETFFEKVFLMMSHQENSKSNCLHILITLIEVFRDIQDSVNKRIPKKLKKAKTKSAEKPESLLIPAMHRSLDPANILMSNMQYFNKIKALLLYPDYETVEQAITLIKALPILEHSDSAVFICAFLDCSEETNQKVSSEFKEKMGFTMSEPQHVYFWLQFMKSYFKQMDENEEITFLRKFESFEAFNISMICSYLQEISQMSEDELHKIPLFVNI